MQDALRPGIDVETSLALFPVCSAVDTTERTNIWGEGGELTACGSGSRSHRHDAAKQVYITFTVTASYWL
jgi:hypothetical protein